jgi:predicted acetyltransferase
VEVRDTTGEELPAWVALNRRAFLDPRRSDEADLALRRRRFAGHRLSGAYEGGRVIGTFRSWDVDLPVPGAVLRASAISSVSVSAAHRRRGVLTAMMSRDLRQSAERGTPLAVLLAAEAPIYGRFGFGAADEICRWTLDADAAAWREDPVREGRITLELVEDADLRPVAPDVHARAAAELPGAVERTDLWWDTTLGLEQVPGDDPAKLRPALLARDPGGQAVGYARYSVAESWKHRRATGTLTVTDLAATSADAHLALWRALAETDWVATVVADDRPPHDPLPWLLADRRAAAQEDRGDFTWVRLLDVPAALAGRRYAVPGAAVLDVVDPAGLAGCRVRLEAGADGAATAEATRAAPDVVLGVDALGAAYLGQVPLAVLHGAGLVQERTPGAVAALTAVLAWAPRRSPGLTWF